MASSPGGETLLDAPLLDEEAPLRDEEAPLLDEAPLLEPSWHCVPFPLESNTESYKAQAPAGAQSSYCSCVSNR